MHSLHTGGDSELLHLATFHAQIYRIIWAAIENDANCHDEIINIRSNPFENETGLYFFPPAYKIGPVCVCVCGFTQGTLYTTTTVYGVLVHQEGAICTTKAQNAPWCTRETIFFVHKYLNGSHCYNYF